MEHATCDVVDIKLPDSLWGLFNAAARRQGICIDEAVVCLIGALFALTSEDFINLREPPRETLNRICHWSVGRNRKYSLERYSFKNGFSPSSLLRRVLYAILISEQILIINSKYEPGMRLQRAQMHFGFIKDYRRAEPPR